VINSKQQRGVPTVRLALRRKEAKQRHTWKEKKKRHKTEKRFWGKRPPQSPSTTQTSKKKKPRGRELEGKEKNSRGSQWCKWEKKNYLDPEGAQKNTFKKTKRTEKKGPSQVVRKKKKG